MTTSSLMISLQGQILGLLSLGDQHQEDPRQSFYRHKDRSIFFGGGIPLQDSPSLKWKGLSTIPILLPSSYEIHYPGLFSCIKKPLNSWCFRLLSLLRRYHGSSNSKKASYANPARIDILQEQIDSLFAKKGPFSQSTGPGFSSRIFVVPQKLRRILSNLNFKALNQFLKPKCFKWSLQGPSNPSSVQ